MTNDPCKYCGKHHEPVGGVVCAYTERFATLANGNNQLVRVQQFFANEIQYDFDWLPPDNVSERNLHELVRKQRKLQNNCSNNLIGKKNKKHYYDTTTKTANPASRGQD